ncbi:MAG: carboxy-S-adenosyl-L-methionine synthase CmoA [Cellvibrionales bacterium TMED49]|nr:carboxy-S-adenosyl-L-methionine synthase CmoA [Porticoccaceae bacterium]OUU35110.1 MAG: carboxy-S-adenosyl-L-methionine synthase CmoA [Cellvibrionales bacterium TMED49]
MENNQRDLLFQEKQNVNNFTFDRRVAEVFPDMIARSVPGYKAIIDKSGKLAARFVQPNSNCYDLGCSLGATTQEVACSIIVENVSIIAIDNSQAMLNYARLNADGIRPDTTISLINDDIRQTSIINASLVILNFTLQFIQVSERLALITKIFEGLKPGGCLILSEKIRFKKAKVDQKITDLHHQFKRCQGYSDLEISQKRESIEDVLIPETIDEHIERLNKIGFSESHTWFQCYNFCSIYALK